MQLALYRLLDEDIELLKGKRLDKDYFNTLLTDVDPVRDLLQWLSRAMRSNRAARQCLDRLCGSLQVPTCL